MNRDSYSPLMSKRFQCWSKIYFTDDRFFGANFAIFGSLANFGSSNALGWATAFWRRTPPTNLIRKETTHILRTSNKSGQKRNNKYFAHLQQIWSEKKQQIFCTPPTNLIRKETSSRFSQFWNCAGVKITKYDFCIHTNPSTLWNSLDHDFGMVLSFAITANIMSKCKWDESNLI